MSTTIQSASLDKFAMRLTLVAALVMAVGCGPTADPEAPVQGGGHAAEPHEDPHGGHAADGHDDHAGHSHEGKHGGHVVVLEPGHVHAEFVHVDEDEVLEIYVDEIADKVTGVEVVSEIAGQDAKTYTLEASDALGTGGYQVKDAVLLTNIQMADGETNKVTLNVMTADGTMSASLMDDHDH
jgi:hypothetical protein